MFGLIDCNNFFVSCERIFRPDVANRPVVVMSNNDGCAVAMSNEAKALGIKRGVPVYQVKQLIRQHNVITFSGNHRLYGDISSRVMATIASIVPEIEVYSIDEAFLDLSLFSDNEVEAIGRQIVKRVRRDVGIPTSLGIAPTKTLAKIASHFAKKYPGYRGVCIIDSDEKRRKALALTEIGDVWGIGRRLSRKMESFGLRTALDYANLPLSKVKQIVNIVGERTWRELNGIPCIEFEPAELDRQQICVSRSFSKSFTDIEPLREAISTFASNIARKLRRQRSCARVITVFIQTNSFRPELPQHIGNLTWTLEEASDDTLVLTSTALQMLYKIYRKGYAYKRAGVIVTELVNRDNVQQSLFSKQGSRDKRRRLMDVIDSVNLKGSTHDKVKIATSVNSTRLVRREELSPFYTTRLSDIITVKV